MPNDDHLQLLKAGTEVWHKWRQRHEDTQPDLSHADLHGHDLRGFDLSGANLQGAFLAGVHLEKCSLSGANLTSANLMSANLSGASLCPATLIGSIMQKVNLTNANACGSSLFCANLAQARLTGAKLTECDLSGAVLVGADLRGADISGCGVYGISAWNVVTDDRTNQSGLIITQDNEPAIRTDSLELAQFLNLLRTNSNIRQAFDAVSAKVVLILGRFSPERKDILDALRKDLQERDLVPIVFDVEQPSTRSLSESVRTLAHLSRFIIADLTEPASVPYELGIMVSVLTSVPLQPIILAPHKPFAMFKDLQLHGCVLDLFSYKNKDDLLRSVPDKIIGPCERKRTLLLGPT